MLKYPPIFCCYPNFTIFYQKLQIKLFAIKFNKLTDYEDFDKILLLFWGREDHDSKFFV